MAFDNVTFPYYPMKHGVNKRITDPVSVSSNGTYEYRVKRSRWDRYSWTLPTQTMTDTQKESVRNFLLQRGNALNSFRFVDPTIDEFVDAPLAHVSGDYWRLALPYDSSTPGTHPIFNPVLGELSVTVGGSPDSINAFTVLNGVPVIQITGTVGTETVKVSGPIYFTVRLNNDLNYALVALDTNSTPIGHSMGTIELTEVFGEY